MREAYRALTILTLWLDRLVASVTGAMLVTLILLNGVEIVSRSLFDYSLFWAFEIYQLLGNWMYFLGIALVYYRSEDITLDFLYDKLRPRGRHLAQVAIQVVVAGTLLALAWYSFALLDLQSRTRTTGLGIPNHYYSLPILVGTLIMLANVIRQLLALALFSDEASRDDG